MRGRAWHLTRADACSCVRAIISARELEAFILRQGFPPGVARVKFVLLTTALSDPVHAIPRTVLFNQHRAIPKLAPPVPPFPKQLIEPSGASASGSRGGGQSQAGAGTGRRNSGGVPGANAAGRGDGAYCYDPWGGWVLENYSLYTTVLAAFVRQAGNMSFKVGGGRGLGGSLDKWFNVDDVAVG